jgi:hypothetical protein
MDPDRMVEIIRRYGTDRILVNSAADWGRSDPLSTLRTADALRAAGFADDAVDQVLWRNPVRFYGTRRLILDPVPGFEGGTGADGTATFAGNSVLRGGGPE